MSEMKPFKALLLDERDVLVGVVELEDEKQLDSRYIDLRPHGGDCDRPAGEYRWNREQRCLEPLPRQQRAQAGRPTFEMAVAFDYLDRWDRSRLAGAPLGADSRPVAAAPTEVSLAWLDDAVRSFDFKPFADLPLVQDYQAARGLNKG